MALDQGQRIFVFAPAHLRFDIFVVEPGGDLVHVTLRHGQEQRQHRRNPHDHQQAAVADRGDEGQPCAEREHCPARVGQEQREEHDPEHARSDPAVERGFGREDLRGDCRADDQQEAAEVVRIDPGADCALVEHRAVGFAVAQHAADRVFEAAQAVEHGFRECIRQRPQHDPQQRGQCAETHHHDHGPAQQRLVAHHIDQDRDQQQAHDHFEHGAQRARINRGMAQAHQIREKHQPGEAEYDRRDRRRAEQPPLPGHPLHEVDERKRPQRAIEKGRCGREVERHFAKRDQRDHGDGHVQRAL